MSNQNPNADHHYSYSDQYEALMPLLKAMVNEFRELSKKKPEAVASVSKIKMVNRLLKDILILLEYQPTKPYLDLLNEDDLPQNSDIILILSQFEAGMMAFKDRYYTFNILESKWSWNI